MEARHRDATASASGIIAVEKNNSTAMTDMNTAARLTGVSILQPCPCLLLPRAVVENTIKNWEGQVTCFFASNIRASTVNSYRRIEYKSYVIFSFYVDSRARGQGFLIPLTMQGGNQS